MRKQSGLLLILTLFFLVSCSKDRSAFTLEQRGVFSLTTTQQNVITPDFESIFENIFKPKCLKCHTGDGDRPTDSSTPLNDYEEFLGAAFGALIIPEDWEDSYLNELLTSDDPKILMPRGITRGSAQDLSEAEKKVIQEWIEKGAPEKAPQLAPNFDSLFELVFKPKCLKCHTGDGDRPTDSSTPLNSYEDFLNASFGALIIPEDWEDSYLNELLTSENPKILMPRGIIRGSAQDLTETEKKTIQEWIEKGAPEK